MPPLCRAAQIPSQKCSHTSLASTKMTIVWSTQLKSSVPDMHPAVDIFERIRVQFSPRKLKYSYFFSLSFAFCQLFNYFHSTTLKQTVELHLKRSSHHFISRTNPSCSPLSRRFAAHPPFSSSQPSLPCSSSPSFGHTMAFLRKKRLSLHEELPVPPA